MQPVNTKTEPALGQGCVGLFPLLARADFKRVLRDIWDLLLAHLYTLHLREHVFRSGVNTVTTFRLPGVRFSVIFGFIPQASHHSEYELHSAVTPQAAL